MKCRPATPAMRYHGSCERGLMNVAIVLNYNDADTTLAFVEAVRNYRLLDKIVLVDNASSDNSVERLAPVCDEHVVLVESGTNGGYAAGNSLGVREAERRWPQLNTLVITNPDIVISEDDLARVLAPLDEGYAMATGVIHVPAGADGRGEQLASNFAWRCPTMADMMANAFYGIYLLRRRIFKRSNYYDATELSLTPRLEVECVPGCFFAIRDDAMRQVGYFDERTFLWQEETILGARLRDARLKTCVVTDAHVRHECSVSINKSIKSAKRQARILLDSQLVYLEHYCHKGHAARVLYQCVYWLAFAENRLVEGVLGLAQRLRRSGG